MKVPEPPTAKFDKQGQLITTRSGILSLYEQEYKDRLSKFPPHQGYELVQSLKDYLFKTRFMISSSQEFEEWKVDDLLKVGKSLKNNKARDCEGFIYELFKPSKCGSDIIQSITKMFNSIKSTLNIPNFMEKMTITSIKKRKGLGSLLSSERGIFNLSKLRSLLDK